MIVKGKRSVNEFLQLPCTGKPSSKVHKTNMFVYGIGIQNVSLIKYANVFGKRDLSQTLT